MGTSQSATGADKLPQDHPHAYGDKDEDKVVEPEYKGSSPRVWGQDDIILS